MHDWWPLLERLQVQTPSVCLRCLTQQESQALGEDSAGQLVADVDAGYLKPWVAAPTEEYLAEFQARQERARREWSPTRWKLPLGVFPRGADRAVGMLSLSATDYATHASITTGSWLLPSVRGRGWGRELRQGAVCLGFGVLGAREMLSDAQVDNAASLHISHALGYEDYARAISPTPGRSGEPVELIYVRLERHGWTWPDGYSARIPSGVLGAFGGPA